MIESEKKELVLSTNVFDKPTELQGPKAWVQLIVNLLFLRPGTFPGTPAMGIAIQDYNYEFMDTAISRLETEIPGQVRTYLPDVPLESVDIRSLMSTNGTPVLVIILNLIDNGSIVTAALASEVTNKIINFELSWAS